MNVAWGLCWGGSRSTKPCVLNRLVHIYSLHSTACRLAHTFTTLHSMPIGTRTYSVCADSHTFLYRYIYIIHIQHAEWHTPSLHSIACRLAHIHNVLIGTYLIYIHLYFIYIYSFIYLIAFFKNYVYIYIESIYYSLQEPWSHSADTISNSQERLALATKKMHIS